MNLYSKNRKEKSFGKGQKNRHQMNDAGQSQIKPKFVIIKRIAPDLDFQQNYE